MTDRHPEGESTTATPVLVSPPSGGRNQDGDAGREVVLELARVSRQFGAVRALTDVSFECRAGEVHAVV
ncbi:MAG TPA: hypothetical protein VGK83_02195, partial [Acidimicrobiia bacterium]